MRKRVLIIGIIAALLVTGGIVAYQQGTRYVLNKARSVLTEDNIAQINDFFKELTLAGYITDTSSSQHEERAETVESEQAHGDHESTQNDGNNLNNSYNGETEEKAVSGDATAESSDNNVNNEDIVIEGTVNDSTANAGSIYDAAAEQTGIDIEALSKQVSFSDQIKGVQLALKIDIGYVLELIKPGLTPEVKAQLKDYMREKYTQDEITEIYELYNRYMHLLSI